ncbi:phosphotransferase [Alkalimarinus coralli]|uniref:phosphotransferase n=1 Tax=Alkalimarinus coralli TaxID=2935863 RepID=UPI00202B6CBA|nr:phosphotransferase [Alkalimarinus coralli]
MLPNTQEFGRYINNTAHQGMLSFTKSGEVLSGDILTITPNGLTFIVESSEYFDESCLGLFLEDPKVFIDGEFLCDTHLSIASITPQTVSAENGRLQLFEVKTVVPETDNASCLWQVLYQIHRESSKADDQPLYDALTLPKVPARGVYSEEARLERLAFIRENTDAELTAVEKNSFDANKLMSNIEAFIGSVEVPVGVAGPLLINGQNVNGLMYAPMATSEGALVASATRGATVLSRCGGVNTKVLGQRMLRVPLFVLSNMQDALFFANWIESHFNEIKEQTKRFSNYADLKEVEPQVFGKAVHVHFVYETGDAAGQNMTTTCTWQACLWVMEQMKQFESLKFENFMIEANLSNDKKVTYQSFLKGRGVKVMAECILPAEHTERVLKVTPKQLVEAYQNFVTGSIGAGMVGININIANVIGAMFTATGQDIACVHESSIGQFHLELTDDGRSVYASMILPSLVIGTVGGGTSLTQQRECLELLGCAGPGKAARLAEIICGYCLALDLSTLSAIASGQFASAHERLGRNRPVDTLKQGDLNPQFFQRIMRKQFESEHLTVGTAEPIVHESKGSSIITELTAHKVNKILGHFPYSLSLQNDLGKEETKDVMVKVKPLDAEVIMMLNSMAAMCDPRLAQEYNRYKDQLGFRGCHQRELAVMTQKDPRFTRNSPLVYGVYENEEREAYLIVEELMTDMVLMDSADDVTGWTNEHIKAAIKGISEVHSIWFGREEELRQQPWIIDAPTKESRVEKQRLWEMLGVHAREEFPEWFSDDDLVRYRDLVKAMPKLWDRLESMPKTLIHNDFNPRNIAFRKTSDGLRLCAYDWELATVHLPQYDVAELMAFTLTGDFTRADIDELVEYHRLELEKNTGVEIDAAGWRDGFSLCIVDLLVTRMSLYAMAHTFRHYKFMERVHSSFRRLLEIEIERACK